MRQREVIVTPTNARRLLLTPISTAILSLLLPLSIAAAAPPAREAIEWCDIWISHANETNLPRVLLIGDSIARDYYPEVEKRFAGKAFVARLATSRFVADPVLLREIELVLSQERYSTTACMAGSTVRRSIERHSTN